MKILHIINSLNRGGAESVLSRLILNDKKNLHFVFQLLNSPVYYDELNKSNIKIINLDIKKNYYKINFYFKTIKKARDINPDLIQSWMYHSNFFSCFLNLFLKKKLFWNIRHGNIYKSKSKYFTKVIVYLCGFFSYFFPNKIIFCSNKSIKNHQKYFYSLNKALLIYNGFDEKKFFKDTKIEIKQKNNLLIKDKEFVIGKVANWRIQKNHENLFRALSLINDDFSWKLILAGSKINNENYQLIKLLKKYKIYKKTIILGEVIDTNNIYNLLDVNILSSFDESFPNVIAESMLACTPCISTDVGDSKVIISKQGWICKNNDSQDLKNSILNAYKEYRDDNKKWNLRMIDCRKNIIENYSLKKMIINYQNAWNNR